MVGPIRADLVSPSRRRRLSMAMLNQFDPGPLSLFTGRCAQRQVLTGRKRGGLDPGRPCIAVPPTPTSCRASEISEINSTLATYHSFGACGAVSPAPTLGKLPVLREGPLVIWGGICGASLIVSLSIEQLQCRRTRPSRPCHRSRDTKPAPRRTSRPPGYRSCCDPN